MKTSEEWSLAFDLLYNNITSNQAPGLENYEKSVFLTQAQNALVKDYFSRNHNVTGEGYDDSIRRQSDFRSLIASTKLTELSAPDIQFSFRTDVNNTKYFEYPFDALFVLNDEVSLEDENGSSYYTVVPISYDEYARLMKRPYKFPPKGMMWRLITNTDTVYDNGIPQSSYQVIELIGRFRDRSVTYKMHYVKRPSPIVLGAMPDGLSVEGVSADTLCKLPEHLHDEILHRAVQLAKISWSDSVSSPVSAG